MAEQRQDGPPIRIPLAVTIQTKSPTDYKSSGITVYPRDSFIMNGFVDSLSTAQSVPGGPDVGGTTIVEQRPGSTGFSSISTAGMTQGGLFYYTATRDLSTSTTQNDVLAAVVNSTLRIYTGTGISTGSVSSTFTGLFPGHSGGGSTVPQKIFFEGIPLEDEVRTTTFPQGTNKSFPRLEGFFLNNPRAAYFYHNATNSLARLSDPHYPFEVVGGIAWFNGRAYVMTPEARIYASGINTYFDWNPLAFISAIMNPDAGRGVVRHKQYVVAFGKNSIEWFYDTGAVDNPLRRVEGSVSDLGCVDASSIVPLGDTLLFAGQRQDGREIGVFMFEGYRARKVSTPYIDRIMTVGNFSQCIGSPLFYKGHRFYLLAIEGLTYSLVYDLDSQAWYVWSLVACDIAGS